MTAYHCDTLIIQSRAIKVCSKIINWISASSIWSKRKPSKCWGHIVELHYFHLSFISVSSNSPMNSRNSFGPSPTSQRTNRTGSKRTVRKISRIPYKVLDAPALQVKTLEGKKRNCLDCACKPYSAKWCASLAINLSLCEHWSVNPQNLKYCWSSPFEFNRIDCRITLCSCSLLTRVTYRRFYRNAW